MSTFEQIHNIYDLSLKARLLRLLIREYVPDEKHPFQSPSDLTHVVSVIKTHRLLSEFHGPSEDLKKIEKWSSAVDAWVNRLLNLISGDMPDKCWAGLCLLGVTCQECSAERFLASYSVWYNKLLLYIQPSSDLHFLKVVSCNSMSDLFIRLSGFPNMKKDSILLASKLIQSVLQLLNEDCSDAVLEGSVSVLCTIIVRFPSSLSRHYDRAEAAIVSKIMSGKYSVDLLKKLGHCLALLPKSRGDDDSWSLMMKKILISINAHINNAFQGFEEEGKSEEVMRLLVPSGKDPPPPLGGQTRLEELFDQATNRPEQLLISVISTLMFCSCEMLTNAYPAQVVVPIRPLIILAGRVLSLDGSLSKSSYPYLIVMEQEFILSELPTLHLCSLELLAAVIKGARSQLLPYAADVARLLIQYFKKSALPDLRIKIYSIIKMFLISLGVGIAIYLAEDVVNNALIDLEFNRYKKDNTCVCANTKKSSEELALPSQRKRKHTAFNEQQDEANLEVEQPQNMTPLFVKIAALRALETLLTVAGASKLETLQSNINHLIITVARNACSERWTEEEPNIFCYGECVPTWADFQLAALRALLASLLSTDRMRPPHLAQGLELFRRGKQEVGTELSEFCAHALLALEVLIHPRALPLVDCSPAADNHVGLDNRFYSNNHTPSTTFPVTFRKESSEMTSDDDDLYEIWMKNGEAVEVAVEAPAADQGNVVSNCEKPLEENVPGVSALAVGSSKSIDEDTNLIMMEAQQHQDKQSEQVPYRDGMVAAAKDCPSRAHSREAPEGAVSDGTINHKVSEGDVLEMKSRQLTLGEKVSGVVMGKDVKATENKQGTSLLEKISNKLWQYDARKDFLSTLDSDSSADSIPDIVDGDVDSD